MKSVGIFFKNIPTVSEQRGTPYIGLYLKNYSLIPSGCFTVVSRASYKLLISLAGMVLAV